MEMSWLSNLMNIKLDPGLAIIFGVLSGFGMYLLRTLPMVLWNRIVMTLTVKVTIDENDNMSGSWLFSVFNEWVSKNRVEWLTRIYDVTEERKVVAGTGFNVFFWRGKLFWCYMGREKPQGTMHRNTLIGSYTIFTWKWNRAILDEFVLEATDVPPREFKGGIYNDMRRMEYTAFLPYVKHQPQLISKDTLDELHALFQKFLAGPEEYHKVFRPHKETIMLFGPPGTGKTSVIRHLCAFYNCDMVMVDPSTIDKNTFKIRSGEARIFNGKTVYVIEDIDSNKAFWRKDLNSKNDDSKIVVNTGNDLEGSIMGGGTITELLNALDGSDAIDDAIVFITTNHHDRLEEAIYRVGRVDHLIPVNYISFNEATAYLDWTADDERYQYIVNDSRCTHLPAGTLHMLHYCDSVEQIEKVLSGKELSLSLAKAA